MVNTSVEACSKNSFFGELIGTVPTYAVALGSGPLKHYLQEWSQHPREQANIDDLGIRDRVARVDTSLHEQALLVHAIFELNPGLAEEITGGNIHSARDFLDQMIAHNDIEALRIVPDLSQTLLELPNVVLPVEGVSDGINMIQYHPQSIAHTPFSDGQLEFIQKHGLDGGINLFSSKVMTALLGVAQLYPPEGPVYYSSKKPSTRTVYEDRDGNTRVMRTSHHGVKFSQSEEPQIFDISPNTGRILKRK